MSGSTERTIAQHYKAELNNKFAICLLSSATKSGIMRKSCGAERRIAGIIAQLPARELDDNLAFTLRSPHMLTRMLIWFACSFAMHVRMPSPLVRSQCMLAHPHARLVRPHAHPACSHASPSEFLKSRPSWFVRKSLKQHLYNIVNRIWSFREGDVEFSV